MNDGLQYLAGLNLGPVEDHTSLAVVQRRPDPALEGGFKMTVVGLDRCPQGTPYPEVVEWVTARLADYPADQIALTVGGTVVDPTVVELLKQAGFGAPLEAVTIVDE